MGEERERADLRGPTDSPKPVRAGAPPASILKKYRDALAGAPARPRPVPRLKLHRGTGQAYVSYRVGGRRRYVYLGPWGSPTARARYAKFAREWPQQIDDPGPVGTWPAPRLLELDGRRQRLRLWAKETGLTESCIRWRLTHGWPVRAALTTPKVRPLFARQPTFARGAA